MATTTMTADQVLSSLLGEELEVSAFPLPARTPDADALVREAQAVAAMQEIMLLKAAREMYARQRATVGPLRGAS